MENTEKDKNILTGTKKDVSKMPEGVPGTGKKGEGEAASCPACSSGKTKERSEAEFKDLIHRLNRIEGQIRGIKGMVENNAYCPDILVQVSAVTAALNSFNKELLANHIKTCVTDDIKAGREETVDELLKTLQKLMK